MIAKYTPRQGQYLAFIDHYTKVNGRPPAEADLQRHFDVSAPSVHQMILTLEKRGLVERTPGKALHPCTRATRKAASPGVIVGPATDASDPREECHGAE